MGRTFRRNDRWKKDRKAKDFQKSKKYKEFQQKPHSSKHTETPIVEIEDDYDSNDD